MQRTQSPLIAAAVCLSALAGFVDAIAFIGLGGFFASFMSGNSTRLGVGLANGEMDVVTVALALVMSFVSGVILSSVIVRAAGRWRMAAVMGAVTLLLVAAALFGTFLPGMHALLLLAVAMGAENGVFNRDGEVTIGLTYMTGSLVRMGQKLANALMGETDRWGWLRYLWLWAGFVAGVTMGATAHFRFEWNALWFAAGAAAALTALLARIGRNAD